VRNKLYTVTLSPRSQSRNAQMVIWKHKRPHIVSLSPAIHFCLQIGRIVSACHHGLTTRWSWPLLWRGRARWRERLPPYLRRSSWPSKTAGTRTPGERDIAVVRFN